MSKFHVAFALLCGLVGCTQVQPGVWGWTGFRTDGSLQKPPATVRGSFMLLWWDELEPSPGQYDWSAFDRDLTIAADHGVQMQPAIWIYDATHPFPGWLKKFSAPVEYHLRRKDGRLVAAPNYKDTAFHDRLQQLIEAFAAHIGELPAKLRKYVWAVQIVCGITGDNRPWNGYAAKDSDMPTADEWKAYTRKIANTYINAFKKVDVGVIANLRRGPFEQEDQGWFVSRASQKGLQEIGLKEEQGTMLAQMNGERQIYNQESPLLRQKQSDGTFARGRGEMTSNIVHQDVAPFWNLQATAEWALTFGIDSWNLDTKLLTNKSFAETLNFFNRHAGQKDPAKATAAFISFRDALDTLDTKRWPVKTYGDVDSSTEGQCNKNRMQKIVSENSKRGASLGCDDGYSFKDGSKQKNANCIYDVGYDIFWTGGGNYGQHIEQIDPLTSSVGWWQLGPSHQPYGRFARGLQHSSRRSMITLQLDKQFSHKGQTATVRVVFFDRGSKRWCLTHNADRVLTAHKGNTKKWKTAEVEITLASSSQLKLFSPDNEDVEFSLIEVLKKPSSEVIV